ncbi:uncharacterized protein OCT59_025368 [Rhizophagus irregularis]|uniref:uncharacterized protein n=1 Tax=Rhizophagus irregularis TaxID=588596 RepID=UPI001A0C182B|nr:hypothetical protein OCT59_025368 [Rhizophagus irregularis]GBC11593.2 hypothetical protein GLOIN_2v1835204 [Rhizophagus irregularis DAOM 181602=DAOM 197198]
MEKQMQDSIRYSTVLTIIEISDHVEIGKLIGRNGRNLKPIEKGTGTHIYINTKKSPQQIEIKINNKDNEDRDENISTGERINKAICQIDKLLEDIEIRNRRKDIEKEKNNSRISDNGNHQHATVATPRNHKDNDQKEKRKRSKRKMPNTTKTRQSQNKENVKRNSPVNRINYNQSN